MAGKRVFQNLLIWQANIRKNAQRGFYRGGDDHFQIGAAKIGARQLTGKN